MNIIGMVFGVIFIVAFAAFWLGMMGFLLYIGGRDVVQQQKLLHESKPVAATITQRTYDSRTSKGKTSYYPQLKFAYQVDGKRYESDRLTPLNYYRLRYSTSQGAIDYLREQYPSDQIEAQYLPSDPTLAYVRRDENYGGYVMVAGGILMATPLVWLLLNLKQAKNTRDTRGRLVLRAWRSLGKRKLDNGLIFLLLAMLNGVLLWHFLKWTSGPHNVWTWVLWSLAAIVPALALFGFVRAYFIGGVVSDATITLDDLRPGRSSTVIVEQDVLVFDTSVVEKVQIGVTCTKTTGSGKHAKVETAYQQAKDYPASFDRNAAGLAGGKRLRVEGLIALPAEAPVSAPGHVSYAWMLNVRTFITGKPDYVVGHTVEVKREG
jgi:hypothetical protein